MSMILEMHDICKDYPMGKSVLHVLSNIDLSVEQGEYLAIMGPSGSGKTTLMNVIGCLDTPTSGSYLLDGSDVSEMTEEQLSRVRSRKIGFVFQSFNLIPLLTAKENVELPLMYRGEGRKQRSEKAMQALEVVGLADRAAHRPSELSGGQQQRAAIARAIAADPAIILADEPCGNLDSKNGREVIQILSDLNLNGKTIVMITHDEQAAKKAQRLIRIADGRIVM